MGTPSIFPAKKVRILSDKEVHKQDYEAMKSDWEAVRNDLRKAMNSYFLENKI